MTSVPDRTPFQIRHAQPVAGPGVDSDSAAAESAPAARRQRASRPNSEVRQQSKETQKPSSDQKEPAVSTPPDRRHTLVDLETVMHMLDMVKASERDHLRSVLHIFNLLGAAGRVRVLHVLNQVFRKQP